MEKRKEQVEEIDDIERRFWGFIFIHNTKSSSFGVTQKLYWGFWRVYMNSSNLIYIVIVFLKLKIY